jgi:hypothetical protein
MQQSYIIVWTCVVWFYNKEPKQLSYAQFAQCIYAERSISCKPIWLQKRQKRPDEIEMF